MESVTRSKSLAAALKNFASCVKMYSCWARSPDEVGKVAQMKPCVYILLLANEQYYVGSTNDIERRLFEYNTGHTASIRYKLPATLIFKSEFETLKEARTVECWIKRQKSRKFVEKVISGEIDFSKILGVVGP